MTGFLSAGTLPSLLPTFSKALTTSMPSTISPKMTCLPLPISDNLHMYDLLEPLAFLGGSDEELTSIGIRSSIGTREQTGLCNMSKY